MPGLQFGLQFGILSLQNADSFIPEFQLAIKALDDPKMFLVDLFGLSVLLQDPLRGHPVQIGAVMPVETGKIIGWIDPTRHAYGFSRFRISQLTLESAWIRVQSLWYRLPISRALATMSLRA